MSPDTRPLKTADVPSIVALVVPSYVLSEAVIPETVNALAVMLAVVVWPELIE